MSDRKHYEHVEEAFQKLDDSRLESIIDEFAPIVEPRNRNLCIALASPFALMILGKVLYVGLKVLGHHEAANAVEESNYAFSSLAVAAPIAAGIYFYNSTGQRGQQQNIYNAAQTLLNKRIATKESDEEDGPRAR